MQTILTVRQLKRLIKEGTAINASALKPYELQQVAAMRPGIMGIVAGNNTLQGCLVSCNGAIYAAIDHATAAKLV